MTHSELDAIQALARQSDAKEFAEKNFESVQRLAKFSAYGLQISLDYLENVQSQINRMKEIISGTLETLKKYDNVLKG